ncbi:GNAT family N-acetyltransferase [Bernardetia sp.]|uniref:GNAT family N-acetyltransferase n=1 Tax=Bernardetia sp. TaxID=1937974 RepID=UPI0025B878BF|nr:N-acetyltransferase [Bernardetia sp.]
MNDKNIQIQIRNYQEKDKNSLIKLIGLNIPKYFGIEEEQDFIEYLEDEKEDYFVIEDKITNQIIGCGGINYFENPISARISWDIIHPSFHGKGIGKKLLLHRIEHIKNKKITSVIVRTSQLAYKFYQKIGFKLEKVEKDFWAEGFDLYSMKLEL